MLNVINLQIEILKKKLYIFQLKIYDISILSSNAVFWNCLHNFLFEYDGTIL